MKRKIARFIFSIFYVGSYKRRAVSSSIGLFLGLIPMSGYQWILAIVASLLLRLNLFAVLVGISMSLVVPLLNLGMDWASNQYGFINPFSVTHAWFPNNLSYQIITSIIISCLFIPIFIWVYRDKKYELKFAEEKQFIFQDHGRRWFFIKRSFILLCVLAIITLSVFGASLYINPIVPELYANQSTKNDGVQPINTKLNDNFLLKQEKKYQKFDPILNEPIHLDSNVQNHFTTYGFYAPWDPKGWTDLKDLNNIKKINVLIPEWYSLDTDFSIVDNTQTEVDQLAKANKVEEMPIINNVVNDQWDGNLLHKLLVSPQNRSKLINDLAAKVKQNGYKGINIDFEGIKPQDKHLMVTFITELSRIFHQNGWKVTQDVPVNDDVFDYKALSRVVDQLIVMMYDEHYAGGEPGPIASLGWMKDTLNHLPIPLSKMTVSLGNYGYDWTLNSHQPAQPVSFDEIMKLANQNHLQAQWDPVSKNPYIRYKKGNKEHIIWFLDGTTFYNQMKLLSESGVTGLAFWRIGSEESSIWNLMAKPGQIENQAKQLQNFNSEIPIYTGQGEILHIKSPAQSGERSIELNDHQWISNVSYKNYSTPFEVEKLGDPKGKQVALSFDDGPDPTYTPQILDILDRYHIKASFYIVGQNAVLYPDIVQRIYRAGHDIGTHTYTHPLVANLSPLQTKLEFNATQRLFQAITGHTMVTFRPPFQADAEPNTRDELIPILHAQHYGYTMIGEKNDPLDWQKPPSNVIIQRVLDGMSGGNIILLHDAGGDRSHTVAALPKIIESLKQRGYQFVTASQLMGKTKDQIMPTVQPKEQLFLDFDRVVFMIDDYWQHAFTYLLYAAIGLGFVRVIFLMIFSLRQRLKMRSRREQLHTSSSSNDFNPMVSVVIAAYNEEKVINKTIHSVLKSDYRPLEVIVVNDGSTDQTEAVIMKEFNNNPHVRVITKPNGGKTAAINLGYRQASGEIIVSIDADTIISENTIPLLVRHFQDEAVAAVSGNVKVGNVRNLLTLWQHVEYITGFNLERRAFDELNCIPVVPGAIGAWRKSAVEEVGYFQHDTLAEDTDITLALLRKGYKVHFEDHAYAYTESPEDVKSLLKQRTRWIYGTLQCLWKHRGALFSRKHKTLGFISLPNMWIFQYGVQMISPFVDLLSIFSFFTVYATKTLVFYVAFLVFDMLAAFFAFTLEKENPKPLIWLFIQRFAYRQFMSYVVVKVLISALKGVSVGWNKLNRKGNVSLDQSQKAPEENLRMTAG